MSPPDKDSIRANWRCFVACGVVLLSPFQYGLDFGLIGGLQAMPGFLKVFGHPAPETPIGWNINRERQQLISSLMTLGAFLSSGTAGLTANWIGRKMCLWLACLLCAVSNIIMMTTDNIGVLYLGRLLIGLANGYFMTFSQLYIQESSPAKYRGLFISAFQFSTSFGSLVGNIIDYATAKRPDRSAYLIPLGLIYVFPVFITIGLFFIPESPRWLLLKERNEEGRKALVWLRPAGEPVDNEMDDIMNAIQREKDLSSGVGVLDMFRNPVDRRRTFASVSAVTLQAATGSMFIIAYKAYFFAMANVQDPFAMSCVNNAVGLVAIVINTCVVVRYGRRRVMLLNGLLICGVLQLIVAVVYDKHPDQLLAGKVLVGLSCIYMMSYCGMVSTYAWVAGGEIPSQRLRSHTFGLAAAVGFFFAWLTTFTAPYFINPDSLDWGPKYGYIWFPSATVAAIWVFFCLPETKGRTLEEIDEMFQEKVSARKFRHYHCSTRVGGEVEKVSVQELEVTGTGKTA